MVGGAPITPEFAAEIAQTPILRRRQRATKAKELASC